MDATLEELAEAIARLDRKIDILILALVEEDEDHTQSSLDGTLVIKPRNQSESLD